MKKIYFLIFILNFLCPNISLSTEPNEFLSDANLEIRARDLSKNIRCLVCQNQSIDDSNSELAKDLRMIIRNKLSEGETNNQILDFLVSKYGEFILMKPKLTFKENALKEIALKAIKKKTGARGLRSILENILLKTMYDLPSQDNIEEVIIDGSAAKGLSQPIIVHSKADNKSKSDKTSAA